MENRDERAVEKEMVEELQDDVVTAGRVKENAADDDEDCCCKAYAPDTAADDCAPEGPAVGPAVNHTGIFLDAEEFSRFKRLSEEDIAIAITINELVGDRAKLAYRARTEWDAMHIKYGLKEKYGDNISSMIVDNVTGEIQFMSIR